MSSILDHASQRKVTPFRHDIVGSFLRPQAIKDARAQFQNHEISADELRKIEDNEIIKLVEKQKSVGLKAVTDGEFRRSWWHLDFMWGLITVSFCITILRKGVSRHFHDLWTAPFFHTVQS